MKFGSAPEAHRVPPRFQASHREGYTAEKGREHVKITDSTTYRPLHTGLRERLRMTDAEGARLKSGGRRRLLVAMTTTS